MFLVFLEDPLTTLGTGKEDEAVNVLSALSNLPIDDPYVSSEFTAIKDTVLEMSKGSFSELFTMTEDRHFHRTASIPYPCRSGKKR